MCLIFIFSNSYSQGWETMGKGVINFLLTNPKTANRTNATEAAALNVIGDLLSISAQRKHDINVANAGRSEIVINASGNNNATVYSDIHGNIYLLYNGTIYPVSAGLINQAKNEYETPSIKNATLPGYNLSTLKNEFESDRKVLTYKYSATKRWERYYLSASNESIGSIASKNDISKDDIYFQPYMYSNGKTHYSTIKYSIQDLVNTCGRTMVQSRLDKIYNSQKLLTKTSIGCDDFTNLGMNNRQAFRFPDYRNFKPADGFAIYLYKKDKTPEYTYNFEIVTIFTCNWAKDLNNNGWDFNDFQGIKRSFGKNESLTFIVRYNSGSSGSWILEVYELSTGNIVLRDTGTVTAGSYITWRSPASEKLHSGVFIYNFTMKSVDKVNVSKSEKFEVLDDAESN